MRQSEQEQHGVSVHGADSRSTVSPALPLSITAVTSSLRPFHRRDECHFESDRVVAGNEDGPRGEPRPTPGLPLPPWRGPMKRFVIIKRVTMFGHVFFLCWEKTVQQISRLDVLLFVLFVFFCGSGEDGGCCKRFIKAGDKRLWECSDALEHKLTLTF